MAVKRGICMSKNKLSSLEKKWILYDVGNSAFILLVTTIMPIYFNHLCSVAGLSEDQYLSTWSYAASLATICVALAGPIMGAVSDFKGNKKKVFLFNALLGSLLLFCCCSASGSPNTGLPSLFCLSWPRFCIPFLWSFTIPCS